MVDKKTTAETLRPVLDNSEMIRGALDGGSDNFRTSPSAIAQTRSSEEITSGASLVECDPNVDITYVTSGGTAGDEHVVLVDFPEQRPDKNRAIHVVVLQAQSNPSDVVRVYTSQDGFSTSIHDPVGGTLGVITGVVLSTELHSATFVWYNGAWLLDRTGPADTSEITDQVSYVPALDPNPAEESGYFGVDLGSTEPGFRQFHFGFGASFQVLTAVNEGANGTLDLSGFQGKAVQFTTDGGAHVTNVVLPSFSVTGHDEGVTFYLHCFLDDPGDTAVIDLTNVRTIDGNTFNSITFTDSGSVIFFEYIDGNWRVVRGTAIFDPPLPNVQVPALDPNPAEENVYLGANIGDTAFEQKVFPSGGAVTTEEITSGASPVNCDNTKDVTYVTSGGTAGDEHVVLPELETSSDGNGRTHTVIFQTQTNGSDVVKVFPAVDDNDTLIRDDAGVQVAKIVGGVVLDAPHAVATFVWYDENWFLVRKSDNDSSELTDQVSYVPAVDPNPTVENCYLGFDRGESASLFKTPLFGLIGQAYSYVGVAGAIDASGAFGAHTVSAITDGDGHNNVLTLPMPSSPNNMGARILVLGGLSDPADTITVDLAPGGGAVKGIDGSVLVSITYTAPEQWVLFELWEGGIWRAIRGTAVFDPPLPNVQVPALDPNPAEESGYFGFEVGDGAFVQRPFKFGVPSLTRTFTGDAGVVDLQNSSSYRRIHIVSDGLSHENVIQNIAAPVVGDTGVRQLFTFELGNAGDTATIVPGTYSIYAIESGDTNNITFDTTGQYLLLEPGLIVGSWRIVSTTATIDPPIGVKVTNGVPVTASNIVDFAATFGAIDALTGTIETVTIPGLLTTDHVTVSCIDSPPSGMIIANARVSAADTLEIYIVTAVALGITLGALNFRCLIHR